MRKTLDDIRNEINDITTLYYNKHNISQEDGTITADPRMILDDILINLHNTTNIKSDYKLYNNIIPTQYRNKELINKLIS